MTRRSLIDIRDAIAAIRGEGAATGFMRAASALLTWGVKNSRLETNPAIGIDPLPGGHLPAWTQEQAARAMRELPESLRRVVVLALYTAQRRGDLVKLPWSAYDGATLTVHQEKTGVTVRIPVHRALKAELDTWDRSSPLILLNSQGRAWAAQHLSHQLPSALSKLADFPAGLNIHGLRKLAAANLADAGCTVHEIASITGHKSLSMVQFYTKSADQEKLAEAAIYRLEASGKTRCKTVKRKA